MLCKLKVALDRFGHVVDQRWIPITGSSSSSAAAAIVRVGYGYDQDDNRQWRNDQVAGTGQDEYYTYDGQQRLTILQRTARHSQRGQNRNYQERQRGSLQKSIPRNAAEVLTGGEAQVTSIFKESVRNGQQRRPPKGQGSPWKLFMHRPQTGRRISPLIPRATGTVPAAPAAVAT